MRYGRCAFVRPIILVTSLGQLILAILATTFTPVDALKLTRALECWFNTATFQIGVAKRRNRVTRYF